MRVEQLYTNCLSEAAYFVESEGEIAIIDPLRDYATYLEMATKAPGKIKYIFETHFHADFVSGHLDLSKKTGAPIIYGPETTTKFPVTIAKDGDRFSIGKLKLEVIHTPGHTPESSCYLLYDENNSPYCLFTGDTLFVGDVGRPDLFGAAITKEELASRMYDSLQRLKKLPDDVIVYPAHGPGSSCGKNLGKETWSTIGLQKKMNYAMQDMTRDEFIKSITEGLTKPPQYFSLNAMINRNGYESLDDVITRSLKSFTPDEFEHEMKKPKTVVLDTRHQDVFENGFVPGSLFIGLNDRYAEWVGILLKTDDRILIVAEPGKEHEAVTRMARVGYDNAAGFLKGGFDAWKNSGKDYDMVISVEADELQLDYEHDEINIIDVRKESEYEKGHVEGAINLVLQEIDEQIHKLDDKDDEDFYVHCGVGYRSMVAASWLKRKGYHNIKNVHGGWKAISKTEIPVVTMQFSQS